MDQKERQLLLTVLSRMTGSVFDELDILTLFVLLRGHAPTSSSTREFGHFLVHRARDRGRFRDYLSSEMQHSAGAVEDKSSGPSFRATVMRQAPLYDQAVVLADLNHATASLGLPTVSSIAANDVVACLISLLQGARFVDEHGAHAGELIAGFNEHGFALFAKMRQAKDEVLMFVLGVPNTYQAFVASDDRDFITVPNSAFSLIRVGGVLRAHSE